MKFTHKISRLFGIGTEADPKKNRLSINLTEVAPSLEQQSTPQSELSSPPEHLAFVEKVDITANTRLVEPSNLVTQHDDMALLHKSVERRVSPFPGRTYPTASVTGMPSAV